MGVESSILDLRNCRTYELGKWYAGRSWLPELLIQSPIPDVDTWLAYGKLLSEEHACGFGWDYKETKRPDYEEPWFERVLRGIHTFCVEAGGDVAIDIEQWRYEPPVSDWPVVGSVYSDDDELIQKFGKKVRAYGAYDETPLNEYQKQALRKELRAMCPQPITFGGSLARF